MNPPTTSPLGPEGFWQRVREQEWFLLLVSPRNLLRVLLALGAVDLVCLNMWAVPSALEQTDILAVRSLPLPAARPAVAPAAPQPPAAAVEPGPEREAGPEPAAPSPGRERCALLLFSTGNWWIGPRGHALIAAALPKLLADDRMIEVIGYADRRGAPDLNLRISEERARAVTAVLVQAGVPERRIRSIGAGETFADGSGLDRRTEVTLTNQGRAP
jgi:outer membrane protein OmpA-like peptidoglycan-associated protein